MIDLRAGKTVAEIPVGLHASALALSPGGRYVVCANAASDTSERHRYGDGCRRRDHLGEAEPGRPLRGVAERPGLRPRGQAPLCRERDPERAWPSSSSEPSRRASKLLGLIPVGWYPGAVVLHHGLGRLCVANIKGLETARATDERTGLTGFNSRLYHGSLSLVPVPPSSDLPRLTASVWENYHRERIARALLPPRPGVAAVPVPERIGEPSLFKHVVYVIKENRTYDQVLGDMTAGRRRPVPLRLRRDA